MNPALLAQLKEELLRCEALPPPEREGRLREIGRTDADLESELRSLLDQDPLLAAEHAGAEPLSGSLAADWASQPGLREIGPYRLLDVLGTGGMGIVYRAEQSAPIQREVAVKLLRGGLDPRRILARFTSERRVMALLEHPGIARILDAGQDVDGMPYLVTELVRGVPISDYRRERRPSVPETLRLFIEICRAVQHAHQKGIIHRDLKPSNILVAEVDGVPRPKIIDFGIARILEEEAERGPTLTAEGQAVGTLGYMSPEQAAGSRAIDTRTDVYSLGAVLYEILTGSLPHALDGMNVNEALAALAREEPRPLRTRLDRPSTIDGDLETIVMKALAREPEARYEGAGAFADDLERHLRHEAILARPLSTTYVLRKLIRRHRAGFAIGAAAIASLAFVAVAMSVLYAGQRRERERAETEARKATAISEFLQTMLGSATPREKRVDVQVREVLDDAARRLDFGGIQDPEVESALRRTIGNTYLDLGEYRRAREQLTRAIESRRRAGGRDEPRLAESLHDLAALDLATGPEPKALARADSLCREALRIRRRALGEGHPEVAASLHQLATIHRLRYRLAAAESLQLRANAILAKSEGPESPKLIRGYEALAAIVADRNRIAEADSLYRRSVAIARVHHRGDHPDVADALGALSRFTSNSKNQPRVADSLAVEVLAMERRMWGPRHTRVASALAQLATVRVVEGRMAEAESLFAAAFRIEIQIGGDGTVGAAAAYSNLARGEYVTGRYDRSVEDYRRAVSIWKSLGVETGGLGLALIKLAQVTFYRGRMDPKFFSDEGEPLRLQREALGVLERVWGPDHADVAQGHLDHSELLNTMGRPTEAEPHLRRAIAIWSKLYGDNDPHLATEMGELGYLLQRLDRLSEAESCYRRSIRLHTAAAGGESSGWSVTLENMNLGICLYHQGRLEEAEEQLTRADRAWRRSFSGHPRYAWALPNVASVLLDRGRIQEADSMFRLSLKLLNGPPLNGTWLGWVSWTQNALATIALQQGRTARADSLFRLSESLTWARGQLPPGTQRIARNRYERFRASTGRTVPVVDRKP